MGIPILGTSAEGIDIAEDRSRFDALLETLSIKRPRGLSVMTEQEALAAAEELHFPVLLRPSYVIGGQNMTIAHQPSDVSAYMQRILAQGIENPVLIDQYLMGTELEVDVISDGEDVLIPGVMEHIERAGVHSGDSIAVYPPYNLNDKMLETIIRQSTQLALALGTKGLVNIQYLIYQNELYVIEVNPRASRTVPYISKVTGVPMVDIASGVMLGQPLRSFGFGTGLYKAPPYYAVKVPVFSFEKLTDVNSYLGPEMKSTGEVLGIGKSLWEALFKGLTSAGIRVPTPQAEHDTGVLLSVDEHDHHDLLGLAKKLDDLGMKLYATETTADAIARLGIRVEKIRGIRASDDAFSLLESGKISYIVYTGAVYDDTIADYIALHRRALNLGIACLTSLDTANALADMIASRFNEENTELVDLNHMRTERMRLPFAKMQGTGDDYIFFQNMDGAITCPEAMSITLCNRSTGIGGNGIVLIERSDCADARMRIYNRDGSEGMMAGNCIRSVAKYLHDNGIVDRDTMTIEAGGGVKTIRLYCINNKANLAEVAMGSAIFDAESVPVALPAQEVLDYPVDLAGKEWHISCVSVGNPHCVVFCDEVDSLDLAEIGPQFEHAAIFPERVNTEFVRVVDDSTLKMRVWERGNGETVACGTGACAAAAVAVRLGLCRADHDITVKLSGGDLMVRCNADRSIVMTGNTQLVYEGVVEY
jgi:carbamoyl-phosphate synthase large subunit